MNTTALALAILFLPALAHAGDDTIARIQRAGLLTCGIDQGEAEYSTTDEHGPRVAFDEELCRAVAAAVLGPGARVVVKGYPDDASSMAALRAGEIDLVPTISADLTHSTQPGIALTRPVLYDGTALMVARNAHIRTPRQLSGSKICLLVETETEVLTRRWFSLHHLDFVPFPFQEQGEMEAAFVDGNCTAMAADRTRLAATRATFGSHARDFVILAEELGRDPLAMAWRSDDRRWGNVLEWTINVLLLAEELGVTAANVHSAAQSGDPLVQRLNGHTQEIGPALGLAQRWPLDVLQAIGNFGELYDRTLGMRSPLHLPRAANALCTAHGLLCPLPLK